jgi:DNA-binding NtrC family response regulator
MNMDILVIEDDAEVRDAIVEFLASKSHTVTACGSIAEANVALADYCEEERVPDAIVSHMHLRDGDGVSFFLKASTRFPDVRWILTSAGREHAVAG